MGIKNKSHISGLSNEVDMLLFTELETLLGKTSRGQLIESKNSVLNLM